MFCFWDLVMQIQQILFQLVKSLRSGKWDLYVDSIKLLIAWFFVFDHPNYARWLSIHLYDIMTLPECHPDIFEAFKQGKFAAQKTSRRFSSMALDQAHEQVNCDIKCSGGAVGLFNNQNALQR